MSQCRCEKCSDSQSKTYSESFRVECEARLILTWPLAQRREYLAKLTEFRRKPLEAELMRQWLAKKAAL